MEEREYHGTNAHKVSRLSIPARGAARVREEGKPRLLVAKRFPLGETSLRIELAGFFITCLFTEFYGRRPSGLPFAQVHLSGYL
jgi:hypothetical protein